MNGVSIAQLYFYCYFALRLISQAASETDDICGDFWFKCSDDTCVIAWEFCDGRQDCSDGSDEVTYNESMHTTQDGVPCRNQHIINNVCLLPHDQAHKSFICRQDATCAKDFLCSDGSGCIESSWFCNGYSDCSDGSDELLYDPELHKKIGIPCRNSELKRICLLPQNQKEKENLICTGDAACADGFLCSNAWECIEIGLFCNGEADCSDGSDEINFSSTVTQVDSIPCRQISTKGICLLSKGQAMKEDLICTGDETCANGYLCKGGGECVHEFSFCDGIPDCREGEDEILYNASLHTVKDGIACRNIFTNYICLLPRNQAQKSEDICQGGETCELGFLCLNGLECIEIENFCDGKYDCSDESDEVLYDSSLHKTVDGIPCRQSWKSKQICILRDDQVEKKYLVCSGDTMCEDGYLCSHGSECISGPMFCDGIPDCRDGRDETMYDVSQHSDKSGVLCRGMRVLNNICFLPKDQAEKRNFLCRKDVMCTSGYLCSNGMECIEQYNFCDLKSDCSDGSDEIYYDSSFHTADDGVPCQILESQTTCLLPRQQAEKRNDFCATDLSDVTCTVGYLCENGWECINIQSFCDGSLDCSDGSDEFLYMKSDVLINGGVQCRRSESNYICLLPTHQIDKETVICTGDTTCADGYLCSNGRECIGGHEFCDGWSECSDASDEVSFDSTRHKSQDGVRCRSKKNFRDVCLLPHDQRTKAVSICRTDAQCNTGYICANGKECIDNWMFCNGESQCSDQSDEIRYNTSAHSKSDGSPCQRKGSNDTCLLPKHQERKRNVLCRGALKCESAYLCSDGSGCISAEQFCNGYPQCIDISDELAYDPEKHTKKDGIPCRSTSSKYICLLPINQREKKVLLCNEDETCTNGYMCANGRECIETARFCDGALDCTDGSDEISPSASADVEGVQCRRSLFKNICLLPDSQSWKEQMICTGDASCEEFLCASGDQCISEDWFCDGTAECSDKSDELIYEGSLDASTGEMACRSKQQIGKFCFMPANQGYTKKCKREPPCHETMEFSCSNELQCIGHWMFCDGVPDCSDGSDELVYDSSLRKSDDKLPCRNRRYMNNICLISTSQSDTICAKDDTCIDGFLCSTGDECIPPAWFCDDTPHCSDGSDEVLYNLAALEDGVPCRSLRRQKNVCLLVSNQMEKVDVMCTKGFCGDGFLCSDDGNECVDGRKFCDGVADCSDKSDEVRYVPNSETPEGKISCRSRINAIECLLPLSQIEKMTGLCRADDKCDRTLEYACSNGIQCIKISSFCNGEKDCSDGSDEMIYNTHLHQLEDGVLCRSKRFRYQVCLLPFKQAEKEEFICKKGF